MATVNGERIRLRVLGGFEVSRGLSVVRSADWQRRKAAHLLQRLALERRLLKEQAIEALWPRRDPAAGANNLYRTLYALRRTLESGLGEGAAAEILTFRAGVLRLGEPVWVDAHAFERLTTQAAEAPVDRRRALLEQALALYRGDLLPDERYADWTFPWRTRWRRRYRRACITLALLHRDAAGYDRAVELLAPLLEHEASDEPVHRELMHVYALAGRRDAALRQYDRCVSALAAELGVPPDEQTRAIHAAILSGEIAGGDPPAPTLDIEGTSAVPEPVPAPAPTPLFGREQEVRLIAERLDTPRCRLLTLTGPGGIGKTRLALRIARDKRAAFEHGVVVVSLASLASPALLVPAIAGALKLTLPAGRSPKAHVLAYLRDKRMLLVLDNFEALIEAAPLLTEILAQAPGVKLLVTSREHLNLQQEWVIEIRELSCPEDAATPDAGDYSAVQLFVHTARQLQPRFTLSDRTLPAVVRICRLTGGLPLALELAAGWVRTLPVTDLAGEIARHPDVLTTTQRDVPERHRSLRSVFETSWQRLTAAEQATFSRLSVFQGSFSRDAAEQVAGATLALLTALVTKSRLKQTSAGRYQLHPLLRQFGEEKLRAGDEEDHVRDRHTRYYIDFLEAMAKRLRGGGHDKEALARIDAGIDDVRVAWHRAVARRDVAAVGRGVEGLALHYQIRGRYEEALEALGAALDMGFSTDDVLDMLVRGRLLARKGSIHLCLHRYEAATAGLEESLTLFRAAGAREDMAYAYTVLGDIAALQGLPGQAKPLYQESMAIYTGSGDVSGVAWAHNRLGWVSTMLGEYRDAARHLRRSLAQFRALSNQRGRVSALSDLGRLARRRGAYRRARRHCLEALDLSRQIGYEDGAARTLCELGDVCRDLGEIRRARDYLSESLAIFKELGSHDQILALYRLGHISTLLGEYAVAERQLHESLTLSREAGSPKGVARTLYLLGELALARGQPREAEHRFRESLTRFEKFGDAGHPWGVVASRWGLGRATRALGAYQRAHEHLREALTMALDLPTLPHALDVLVEMAAGLDRLGAATQALELVAFVCDHPATRSAARERAQALFSDWAAPLTPETVTALRARVLAQNVDQVAETALSHHP